MSNEQHALLMRVTANRDEAIQQLTRTLNSLRTIKADAGLLRQLSALRFRLRLLRNGELREYAGDDDNA